MLEFQLRGLDLLLVDFSSVVDVERVALPLGGGKREGLVAPQLSIPTLVPSLFYAPLLLVIPGLTQDPASSHRRCWIPAFTGMTRKREMGAAGC